MRYYETTYILSPDLSVEESKAIQTKLKNVILKQGRILKEEDWGRRRLAYPIDHKDYGNYIYLLYEADESTVQKLEHEMNLIPEVLRYLSVKIKDVKPFLPKEEGSKEETQQGSE